MPILDSDLQNLPKRIEENDRVALERLLRRITAPNKNKPFTTRNIDKPLNDQKDTALHIATRKNHPEIVELLLKYKAKVKFINSNKDTPLDIAVQKGHVDIARQLLDNGAPMIGDLQKLSANIVFLIKSINVLLIMIALAPFIQLLIAQTSLMERNKDMSFALIYALNLLNRLCAIRDPLLMSTFVTRAIIRSMKEILENEKDPLLITAVKNKDVAMVALLLNFKADINIIDQEKRSALHWAVQYNHQALVEILIKGGINLTLRDNNGETALALSLAKKLNQGSDNQALVRYLENAESKQLNNRKEIYSYFSIHRKIRNTDERSIPTP